MHVHASECVYSHTCEYVCVSVHISYKPFSLCLRRLFEKVTVACKPVQAGVTVVARSCPSSLSWEGWVERRAHLARALCLGPRGLLLRVLPASPLVQWEVADRQICRPHQWRDVSFSSGA